MKNAHPLKAAALRVVGTVAVVLLCASPAILAKTTAANRDSDSQPKSNDHAYLGIGVESLPSVVNSQLPDLLEDGCGVLVAHVSDGSPAAEAGLEEDDILVSYDDQRLYSPEQLVKLLWNDRPGRTATLNVIQHGKPHELKVELGSRPANVSAQDERGNRMRNMTGMQMPMMHRHNRDEAIDESMWSSFDSLTLARTGENQYKAEIKYRDEDGKLQTHAFKGSREQIRKDINSEKDLPANERGQLLRALDVSGEPFEFDLPFVAILPREILFDSNGPQRQ